MVHLESGLSAVVTAAVLVGCNASEPELRDPCATSGGAHTVSIDIGAQVAPNASKPEIGIEASPAGRWRVWARCETSDGCQFDLGMAAVALATAKYSAIVDVVSNGLDAGDALQIASDGSLQVHLDSNSDLDEVSFGAPPDNALEVDFNGLDSCYKENVEWISAGVEQRGAPSSPTFFAPNSPNDGG